jgi:hypothetical protein
MEGSRDWMKQAACRDVFIDPSLEPFRKWFDDDNFSSSIIRKFCSDCPVRDQCLLYAMMNNLTSDCVYGGKTAKTRRKIKSTAILVEAMRKTRTRVPAP